jgi:hypothetical protein
MADQDDAVPRRQPEPRPFQFTLRTMFIITTAVAVACGGLSTPIAGVQAATLLYLALAAPMMLTIALIYGRGYTRTFAIGAMFPAALALLYAFGSLIDSIEPSQQQFWKYQEPHREIVPIVGIVLAIIILTGLAAMGIRWMVESPEREQSRQDEK